jgi:anaerobic magnesium-protoporphyrin IX monomethyl ester cyclase
MEKAKKKVLLYNAIQTAYADSDNSPSFSLMALSAYLKQKGYQVELLLNSFSDSELKSALKDCLAVGFSLYTGGSKNAFRMASRIRRINPEISLVWGGYHPTLESEQCLENSYFDYVIRGQGEITLEKLLRNLKDPKAHPIEKIKGISYKKNDKIYHNKTRLSSDINEFPSFDYSIYDQVFKKTSEVTYICSRGCPFSCKFCCSASFNRNHGMKFHQLSLERVFEDLEFIVSKYSPKSIKFFDDNFFIEQGRIRKFIEGYKKRKFNFRWSAFGRCQFFANVDGEVLKQLGKIGLQKVFFGVESGSQRILDMVSKQMKVEDVLIALKNITKYGILADFSFINGFPGEERSDVLKSLELRNQIKKISPHSSATFFVYTPLPGTELTETSVKIGYKKPLRVADWQSYEYHSFRAPWLSRSYQNLVNNISWASIFCEMDSKSGGNIFSRLLLKILIMDANLSFKYKSFGFAPEFRIINSLYRKKLLGR